jgi:RND family efflux transporter MFP subunit
MARAGLIAAAVVEVLPQGACIVHRLVSEGEDSYFAPMGAAGELTSTAGSLPANSRLVAPISSNSKQPLLYSGAEIRREDYAHVHITRSVASVAYLPYFDRPDAGAADGAQLVGIVEVLSLGEPLQDSDLDELYPVVSLAGPAILAAEEFESQRQNLLESVHRMSQLYDLEKSLNATLELDQVTAMAPEKTLAMLDCQAVHLWLVDGDKLRLMASHGADATVEHGTTQSAGEGYVADMAEVGEPLLIADADDERLVQRNAALNQVSPVTPVIVTALMVPLMQSGAEVGVLEAVNKLDATGVKPFDDDDQFFLSAIGETVSNALKNATLMLAERKLEILEALVRVSSEITSTLRLDRLLQIIVNSPQNVLPFERCAIALDNRGRLQLKAVSGMASIPLGDVLVDRLLELVRWLSLQPDGLHLRQRHDTAAEDNLPQAVASHFEATGYRALYSLPLTDDQGRVGLLLYEASDPDFLDLPHTEMIKILAGQATVAIRNALLYQEVPLISLLEPLMQKKQALLRTSGSRRLTYAAVAAAILLFLVFCPLPMRVGGVATIAPQHLVSVTAPLEGNVTSVYAHEGQRIAAGEVLASMTDWQWRTDLASAEARYRAASLVMEASLARGSAQAGQDRAQAEYLRAEATRARGRLDSAQLRSPITGVVATPNLQNVAGQHLDAGATFAQVLDLSSAVVDIAVPQSDVSLIQPGQTASVKLDSYPRRSWHGGVDVVSPVAQAGDGERTFTARVPLPNEDAVLRAGMTGKAKIYIGFRPAGYVLLRRPALWLWQTLWNWIGW